MNDPFAAECELLADALVMAHEALGLDASCTLQRRAIEASKRDSANWRLCETVGEDVLTAAGMAYVARYIRLSVEDPCPN